MKAPKQLKFGTEVALTWADSASEPGWNLPTGHATAKILTRGFVTDSDPATLTVTHSIAEDGKVLTPLSIPWAAVLDFHVVKPLERKK